MASAWLGQAACTARLRAGARRLVVFVRVPEPSGARPLWIPETAPVGRPIGPWWSGHALHAVPRVGVTEAWCSAAYQTTLWAAFERASAPVVLRAAPATRQTPRNRFPGCLSIPCRDEAQALRPGIGLPPSSGGWGRESCSLSGSATDPLAVLVYWRASRPTGIARFFAWQPAGSAHARPAPVAHLARSHPSPAGDLRPHAARVGEAAATLACAVFRHARPHSRSRRCLGAGRRRDRSRRRPGHSRVAGPGCRPEGPGAVGAPCRGRCASPVGRWRSGALGSRGVSSRPRHPPPCRGVGGTPRLCRPVPARGSPRRRRGGWLLHGGGRARRRARAVGRIRAD